MFNILTVRLQASVVVGVIFTHDKFRQNEPFWFENFKCKTVVFAYWGSRRWLNISVYGSCYLKVVHSKCVCLCVLEEQRVNDAVDDSSE